MFPIGEDSEERAVAIPWLLKDQCRRDPMFGLGLQGNDDMIAAAIIRQAVGRNRVWHRVFFTAGCAPVHKPYVYLTRTQ